MDFQPSVIENKWKKIWTENKVYEVKNDPSKPKFYVLDMFPYPSGSGLHVGHPLGYIASDIYARYKRLKGFNVLHPMGYDAFGLPAEQYAIQSGIHPSTSTDQNIRQYRKQLDNIGFSFDWSREVKTSDPSYYKWTQWIFLQLFNHYYDLDENKAKPINDLIKTFEKTGNAKINAYHSHEGIFTADEWLSMEAIKKDEVLMSYRLAYRKTGYVNWCEALGTVLANDEVKDGFSERGGYPVEKRAMKQWSLRITAYAERLLKDLDHLEWSDSLKMMQKNWIGRSEGAQMFFDLDGHNEKIEIFTTRPDTIFGATYMVLAPEHELVDRITTASEKDKVDKYKQYVNSRSEVDRMSEVKEVTGVFTGAYAIHPFTKGKIPVWIGEYVLKDYGTGAIMAVPSDDERDLAFAKKFNLPVIDVIDKTNYPGSTLHDKTGVVVNSSFLNGMEVPDAIRLMYEKIEAMGIGQKKINYKLRDANFSRQRYWGEPFPIYYDQDGVAHGLPEADLPLCLPDLEDFKPGSGGKSPLSRLTDWTVMGDGRYRETDTMPGFAGSSWYFLRYMDANNEKEFASREAVEYWRDVDLYIGGTEHAVGHLMYSRFWHKFLYDKNLVPTYEPFKKLVNQGMIQGIISTIFLRKEKIDGFTTFVSSDLIEKDIDSAIKISVHTQFVKNYGSASSYLDKMGILSFLQWMPEYSNARFQSEKGIFTVENMPEDFTIRLGSEVGKMSKRYHNVVNPDEIVEKYGADCFRMYEMFLGPIDQAKPWDTKGIDGVAKFLRKFWSLYYDESGWRVSNIKASHSDVKVLHATIKKVTDDIEKLSFNTAVSAFMVCVNEFKKSGTSSEEVLEPLLKLMAPFAPFITEELYHRFIKDGSVHTSTFPEFEEKYLLKDNIVYPVCINGKKRDTITLPMDMSTDEVQRIVLNMESIKKWMDGKIHKKFIIVPGRMVNIVI